MSVEMDYAFRSSACGEIVVYTVRRPSGRWVVLTPCETDWDELEPRDARALGECFLAAADKCDELNKQEPTP